MIIRAVLVLGVVAAGRVPWQESIAIREIAVKGGERIQAETVLQRFPIQIGMNWLTADMEAARQALLRLPTIRDARVKRALWGRVLVTLKEREPLAPARLGKELLWMDTEGFLYERAEAFFGPVLQEPQTIQTERGLRLADLFLLVPIGIVFSQPGDFLQRISAVRFEGSTMILSIRDGPDVLLNAYDVQGELLRLHRVLRLLDIGKLQRVDLRFERLVVVSQERTHR